MVIGRVLPTLTSHLEEEKNMLFSLHTVNRVQADPWLPHLISAKCSAGVFKRTNSLCM